MRQRLGQHRNDPTCAVCHNKIDPAGFTLEAFDAVGKLRDHYRDGSAIDSNGLINDQSVAGVVQLKQLLVADKDLFARSVIEQLLEFSQGRALRVQDQPLVESLLQDAARYDYRFQTMVEEVILAVVE